MTLILVFTASLLDAQHNVVKEASLLVLLEKALREIPASWCGRQ